MPERKPHPQRITIYLRPYVRKFVLARLASADPIYLDPPARDLWAAMEGQLKQGCELVRVLPAATEDDRPLQQVDLLVRPRPDGDTEVNRFRLQEISACMTKACLREMFTWVDWTTRTMGLRVVDSLEAFRAHYRITEDDHALATAARMYYGYRRGRSVVR